METKPQTSLGGNTRADAATRTDGAAAKPPSAWAGTPFAEDPDEIGDFGEGLLGAMDPASVRVDAIFRQDTYLIETINRIRRLTGLAQTQRTPKPLLVVVTKLDTWSHMLPPSFLSDPWREKKGKYGLDIALIARRSEQLRGLLRQLTPEIVGAADSISEKVTFLAISALGQTPTRDPRTKEAQIRPADIRPIGVVTPMLYGLFQSSVGLMQIIPRKSQGKASESSK
jgi:hypothetical protein